MEVFEFFPLSIIIQQNTPYTNSQYNGFNYLFNNISNFVINNDQVNEFKSQTSKLKKYSSLFSFGKDFENRVIGNKTNIIINPTHYQGKNIWVIKALNLNRGQCIKIGDNLLNIHKTIKKFYSGIHKEYQKDLEESENIIRREKERNIVIKVIKEKDIKDKKEDQSAKPAAVNNYLKRSYSELKMRVNNDKSPKANSSNTKINSPTTNINTTKLINDGSRSPLKKITNGKSKNIQSGTVTNTKNNIDIPEKDSIYRTSNVLLQKYIESPLTYYERKFDIRIWVLINQDLDVFVFK